MLEEQNFKNYFWFLYLVTIRSSISKARIETNANELWYLFVPIPSNFSYLITRTYLMHLNAFKPSGNNICCIRVCVPLVQFRPGEATTSGAIYYTVSAAVTSTVVCGENH